MTSPIHPDLARSARLLPRGVGRRPIAAVADGLFRLLESLPPSGGAWADVPGGQRVAVFRPPDPGPHPAVLWIHGGGLLFGSPLQDVAWCHRLRDQLGAVVAAVSYRHALQHPYPAALDDCTAALRWLSQQPDVDPSRIAVAGASAGGGLAAATCLRARDEGVVRPAFQLLVYPMLDDRTTGDGVDLTQCRLWDIPSNQLGWGAYLRGVDPVPPLAAPGRCDDLSGVPPAWIGVGTNDLFYPEDVAYAERLRSAGVPCALEVVPGAYHGFDGVDTSALVSRAFDAAKIGALRAALSTGR
jgi:acetyl esterase/lipase